MRALSVILLLSSLAVLTSAEAKVRRDASDGEKKGCFSRCAPQVHTIRLQPGQDLKFEIENHAKKNFIEAGYVATCVGSLRNVTLHYATDAATGKQKRETITDFLEVVALSGSVASSGVHLHMVAGRADGTAVAGHLTGPAVVQFTAEVVIATSPCERYDRPYDPEVGSDQLRVTSNEKC